MRGAILPAFPRSETPREPLRNTAGTVPAAAAFLAPEGAPATPATPRGAAAFPAPEGAPASLAAPRGAAKEMPVCAGGRARVTPW